MFYAFATFYFLFGSVRVSLGTKEIKSKPIRLVLITLPKFKVNWDEYQFVSFWENLDYIEVNPVFLDVKNPNIDEIKRAFATCFGMKIGLLEVFLGMGNACQNSPNGTERYVNGKPVVDIMK